MTMQPVHTDTLFPIDVTNMEAQAGFKLDTIRTPRGTHASNPWLGEPPERTAAVVRELGDGKRAVKVLSPVSKGIEYAVYNEKDRPCEPSAVSLADLARRYP